MAQLLATGQLTSYHVGDDGDYEKGIAKAYTVNSTGSQSGTTNVDVPHYAAATLAFVSADKKITDSGNELAIFKTGDTIKVHGSGSNDGVYTVATGNVAGEIVTTEALVDESAGAVVTLYKRAAVSNNTVLDTNTGLTWLRYTTGGPLQKVGAASIGRLNWYDVTKFYTLHAAAGDLQMIAASKTLKIVGGAGEVVRYAAGMVIVCAGFAVSANNRLGLIISSVAVNGADLDLVLYAGSAADQTLTGTTTNGNKVISGLSSTAGLRIGMAITGTGVGANSVIASINSATQVTGTVNSTASGTVSVTFRLLADEAAAGSRSIKVVCQSIFGYCAAANAVSLGGYSDWRVPNDLELKLLCDMEAPDALPNATAFPSWSGFDYYWSSTTLPKGTAFSMIVNFSYGYVSNNNRANAYYLALVRGG